MSDTGIFVWHLVVRNAILLLASASIVLLLDGNRMGDACSHSTQEVFFFSSSTITLSMFSHKFSKFKQLNIL